MCLSVSSKSDQLVQKLRKKNKTVYAYKAMTLEDYSYRGKPHRFYVGTYMRSFKYKQGLNISNRRSDSLTPKEKSEGAVYKGFHCFSRLIDAYRSESVAFSYLYFFRVKIDPKDVVAIGEFADKKSIVCTKFTVDLNKPSKVHIKDKKDELGAAYNYQY
jgi:hypothetical protein